jgi:VanZ family protein
MILRWLPVIAILIIIYCLSSIPDLHLINEQVIPLWLKQYISHYTYKIGQDGFFSYMISLHPDFILHKIGHVTVFGTLGMALYIATKKSFVWAILLSAVAGMSDEVHQYFIPGRSCRFGDVLLDTLAALVFILVLRKMLVRNHK